MMSVILLAASCSCDDGDSAELDVDSGGEGGQDASVDSVSDASELQDCRGAGTDGATAGCLRPTMAPEYYVEQANKYFDTLDLSRPEDSIPNYSELVARWEWPPWLLLTGYERQPMIDASLGLRDLDPSTVPERDCRFFEQQPFARCYVVFEYDEGTCPIYEEFVFNDAGEMTFIEAWSDMPDRLPFTDSEDRWAQGSTVNRISTRIPGLGSVDGRIDLEAEWMLSVAAEDELVADFVRRAGDFWGTWFEELANASDGFFAIGCGW
jgi:hypothetical protein